MNPPVSTTRRQLLIEALTGAGALSLLPIANAMACAGISGADRNTSETGIKPPAGDIHDFDAFVGTWQGQQRRLKERLVGSTEWVEFDSTQTFRLLLGGAANMTDNLLNLPDGVYRGLTLRTFDPETKTWAIWWLDGRHPHELDVPVIGRFENGTGAFHADDTFNGKPIKVRFTWSQITARSRHWEQAFSPDAGKTWETNWTAHFTRTG